MAIEQVQQAAVDAFVKASFDGNKAAVTQFLDEHGTAIDQKGSDGRTALMCAVVNGNKDMVELLLDRGASLDIKNDSGATALMLAQINDYPEIVAVLEKQASLSKTVSLNDILEIGFLPAKFNPSSYDMRHLLAEAVQIIKENGLNQKTAASAAMKNNKSTP